MVRETGLELVKRGRLVALTTVWMIYAKDEEIPLG